jgi:hypothetical protein
MTESEEGGPRASESYTCTEANDLCGLVGCVRGCGDVDATQKTLHTGEGVQNVHLIFPLKSRKIHCRRIEKRGVQLIFAHPGTKQRTANQIAHRQGVRPVSQLPPSSPGRSPGGKHPSPSIQTPTPTPTPTTIQEYLSSSKVINREPRTTPERTRNDTPARQRVRANSCTNRD